MAHDRKVNLSKIFFFFFFFFFFILHKLMSYSRENLNTMKFTELSSGTRQICDKIIFIIFFIITKITEIVRTIL